MPIEPTPAMLVAMWDHRESMRGQSENRIARAGYAAMLASAPTTEPMSAPTAEPVAWLPISTAPKDGTVVLLCRDDRVTAGHWEPERWPTAVEHHSTTGEYLGQFETGECVEAWWYSEDGGFCEETPPTHWMPLPAPHKEQK